MPPQDKKKAGKTNKPSGWGGARAQSGPKRTEVRKAIDELNQALLDKIAPKLPRLVDNLIRLAEGGFEQVEEKYERHVHKPFIGFDDNGQPMYGTPEESMILAERKVTTAAPDRKANEYLIDRVLGRPVAKQEHSGPEGGSIPLVFEEAAARVYGDREQAI